MEGKHPPIQGKSAQRDPKLPQDAPWKFFCLAMTLMLLLLVLILGVILAEVLQFSDQMHEDLKQIDVKLAQGLEDAGHERDAVRGEVFRQTEAVRAGNKSSCTPCHENWTAFQGSCYQFSTEENTWLKAKDFCAEKDAHLVIINSQAEQKFLSLKKDKDRWIGLRKLYPEGIHKWQDGSVPTFTNWHATESSHYDCALLSDSGSWYSDICHKFWYHWICEKPQVC